MRNLTPTLFWRMTPAHLSWCLAPNIHFGERSTGRKQVIKLLGQLDAIRPRCLAQTASAGPYWNWPEMKVEGAVSAYQNTALEMFCLSDETSYRVEHHRGCTLLCWRTAAYLFLFCRWIANDLAKLSRYLRAVLLGPGNGGPLRGRALVMDSFFRWLSSRLSRLSPGHEVVFHAFVVQHS